MGEVSPIVYYLTGSDSMEYIEEARTMKQELIQLRRHFHMYPEHSGKEFGTADYIANKLEALGIKIIKRGARPQEIVREVYTPAGSETIVKTGEPLPAVVALIEGKLPGKTVALRADMDALAVDEKNDLPYKSKNEGFMHACGHDAHMTILLGAAMLLQKKRDSMRGNVKLIFQPSEEFVGGAEPMISDGVLKNPDVDAIFGLHMDPDYRTGEICVSYGETMASSDRLIIKVRGKSTHGAYPHQGSDALVMAGHVLVGLQAVMSRMKDPLESGVLSFGLIQGGEQPNSIAEEVTIRGILRTFNPEVREQAIANINRVLDGVTRAYNGSYEFTREKSYVSLINNRAMAEHLRQTAAGIIGIDNIKELAKPRSIVEDFAYYLQEVPGAFFFLGSGNPDKNSEYPLHSSQFDIDEDALETGVALMTAAAMGYLAK